MVKLSAMIEPVQVATQMTPHDDLNKSLVLVVFSILLLFRNRHKNESFTYLMYALFPIDVNMASNEGLIRRPFLFRWFFVHDFTLIVSHSWVLKSAGCMDVHTKFHMEINGRKFKKWSNKFMLPLKCREMTSWIRIWSQLYSFSFTFPEADTKTHSFTNVLFPIGFNMGSNGQID